jgi:serine/threonine-protein kinase/endoribonuclease IRE1
LLLSVAIFYGKKYIKTLTPPQDTSIYKIGSLEINIREIIGVGSSGSIIFSGIFNGREVAVKRMLKQFYGTAENEIQCLLAADVHPNVLRYYTKEVDK